jgi:hypothetical protein
MAEIIDIPPIKLAAERIEVCSENRKDVLFLMRETMISIGYSINAKYQIPNFKF